MNRAQRRQQSKKNTYKPQGVVFQHHMSIMQIQAFVEPLESFIDQIANDCVYVDSEGHALMDLPNERIEDMAAKGKQPRRAIDNISSILETYFQVTAYCFSDDDLVRVTDEIDTFKRKIANPLKLGTPIQRSAVEEAKQLCLNLRAALRKAPAIKVEKVSGEIRRVIDHALNFSDGYVKTEDLRAWLMEWGKTA